MTEKKHALVPYLTFNGNCREAMLFYHECLGGELSFQTIGASPMANKMPAEMGRFILHASIVKGALRLLASDMVGEQGLQKGNSVSLMLDCTNEEEISELYKKLSEGGTCTHPLEITFWGATFGNLQDKFGHNWLLHFQR